MTKVTSVRWSHPLYKPRFRVSDTLLGFGCGIITSLVVFVATLIYLLNQGAFK